MSATIPSPAQANEPGPLIVFPPWALHNTVEEISRICYYGSHVAWLFPWILWSLPVVTPWAQAVLFLVLVLITVGADWLIRSITFLSLKKTVRQGTLVAYLLINVWVVLAVWGGIEPGEQAAQGFFKILQDAIGAVSQFSTMIPAQFVLVFFTFITILHGITEAYEFYGPPSFLDSILWGVVGFSAYGIVTAFSSGLNALPWFYGFISLIVVGIFLFRQAQLLRHAAGTQQLGSPRWRLGLIGSVVLSLGLSGFIAALVGAYLPQIRIFLGSILLAVLSLVSLPFAYLLSLLKPLVESPLGSFLVPKTPIAQEVPLQQDFDGPMMLLHLLNNLGRIVKPLVLWGLLILLAFVIVRLALVARRPNSEEEETYEMTATRADLLSTLGNRLLKQMDDLMQRLGDQFSIRKRQRAAARVRQIYSAWLTICANREVARLDEQTPAEHAVLAAPAFPGLQGEINTLVDAYHKVRYGEYPESPTELKSVEQAWERLRDSESSGQSTNPA